MAIAIHIGRFDPAIELAAFERTLPAGGFGATASFVGTMRDINEGDDVVGMLLEHYPGMTERELNRIIEDARAEWPIIDALVVHRVGELVPGEPIVLTAVWSQHRAAAFDACRFLMEALKSRAPFWKKERLADGGERWVEQEHARLAFSRTAASTALPPALHHHRRSSRRTTDPAGQINLGRTRAYRVALPR